MTENGLLRFCAPFGGLTYDVHLRLIGKRVVDFLLALIELFLLSVTAEALPQHITLYNKLCHGAKREYRFGKRRFRRNVVSLAPNFRYKGSPLTNYSSCEKTRINVLTYGTRMWAQVFFVLSQCTRLTDRQTDRRRERLS